MALLKREDIFAAEDIQTERVAVPEWGGEVLVKGLTGAQRDAFEQQVVEEKGKKVKINLDNFRAKLAAYCIVDEEGKRLFSDLDIGALGNKSASALNRVFDVARRLSGLSDSDVEELEKNSASGPTDSSTSA